MTSGIKTCILEKEGGHTILPNSHCCCSFEEAAADRTEGHNLEEEDHILAEDNPEEDNPEGDNQEEDILVGDIPVADKRPLDILLVDNLYSRNQFIPTKIITKISSITSSDLVDPIS